MSYGVKIVIYVNQLIIMLLTVLRQYVLLSLWLGGVHTCLTIFRNLLCVPTFALSRCHTAMTESASIAITTVLFSLIIVDIVGNSLVCVIIKTNRDMRNIVNYLLVNLAVADIVYATFIAPSVLFRLISFHPEGAIGSVLCKFLTGGNVAWVGAVASIFSLVSVAVERYYAVIYPLGNRGNFTEHKLKVIVLVSWILSVTFNIPMFLIVTFDNKEKFCIWKWPQEWMAKAYSVAWLGVVVLPLIFMVGLYSNVVRTLWFKQQHDHLADEQRGVIRVRKRVTLMVLTVTVIFGICFGFMSVVYILRKFTSCSIGPVLVSISFIMVLFNSAVNPFVYALLNKQFREKIKGMMCCSGCSGLKVDARRQSQSIELVENTSC